MKLVIFNGSPRNKKSNSGILINHFLNGYKQLINNEVPVYNLANRKQLGEHIKAYQESEIVLLFFPLYTDCMPGIVKEFFEQIYNQDINQPPKIGFIIQSGFPEAVHSIYIERYLQKLAKRLKIDYLGTVIKGGVEGIQMMPDWMTKKLYRKFYQLGEHFAKTETFSPKITTALRTPYKLSPMRKTMFHVMRKLGIANFYWDSNLKKNNAFKKRFTQPYGE